MSDDQRPREETTPDGFNVWWEPAHFSPDDIKAELPDGTRLESVLLLGGRRLGFERPLPAGTRILLRGRVAWVVDRPEAR